MAPKKTENQNRLLALTVIFALVLALAAAGLTWWLQRQQPETTEAPADAESSLRIPVESPPVIEYNGGESSTELQELTDQLAFARSQYPDLGVLVRGDARGRFQRVAEVLNACKQADVRELGISVRLAVPER